MEKLYSEDIAKLAISVIVCLAPGLVGSVITAKAIPTWYAFLNKPAFTPPNWLFAPVWTALYVMMGVALFKFIIPIGLIQQSLASRLTQ